ncbi:unnamed protein product [Clavelina lepadiformis]|uniref:Uncharacterized protein n=1 Tax=Clavelina lepadiformis TaxID=159417 RepID=A0ABP0G209_CLALP
MIGRADIEGSKSNVAMNAWLPQASYPCDYFNANKSIPPGWEMGRSSMYCNSCTTLKRAGASA